MLKVQTKNLGRMAILSLQGEIVIGQTETLRDAVESLPPVGSLILDLSRVTLMDAHGLGVMLQLRQQSQAEGVGFQLVNVNGPLREVFQITRLDGVFQVSSAPMAHPIAA